MYNSLNMEKGSVLYILLTDSTAISMGSPPSQDVKIEHVSKNKNEKVLKGSLWKEYVLSKHKKTITLISVEFPDVYLVNISLSDISQIGFEEMELLLAITTCKDRLIVFEDKNNWLQEGVQIKVNSYVFIIKQPGMADGTIGLVRYKGELPAQKGLWFGIEIKSFSARGKGTSDGEFRRKKFFDCPPDCALFVNISKVRLCTSKQAIENALRRPADQIGAKVYSPPPQLKIEDRVVWMSDDGPQWGSVKWIGVLEDSKDGEYTVGVHFDNPVGTGTGKYKDKQLFRTPHGHASLIPVLGLIKADEYGEADPNSYGATGGYYDDIKKKNTTALYKEQERLLEEARRKKSSGATQENDLNKPTVRRGTLPMSGSKSLHPDGNVGSHEAGRTSPHNPMYEFFAPDVSPKPVSSMSGIKGPPDTVCHAPQTRPQRGLSHTQSSSFPQGNSKYGPVHRLVTSTSSVPGTGSSGGSDGWKELSVGSVVEVLGNPPQYGVIRWIGTIPEAKDPTKLIAGIEMEEEGPACTDGVFGKRRLFTCQPKKAFFTYLTKCRKDQRFAESSKLVDRSHSQTFGSEESPDIPGKIPPPEQVSHEVEKYTGKRKGIQGHHNSCYLDSTLFSMFSFSFVFDELLFRPRNGGDISDYQELQTVIREGIVNPLRQSFYVRADKILKLRAMLDRLGSIKGMMSEEKDPEEFLNLLLSLMKADPFIKLSNGTESYLYQLFLERDERLRLPTTQNLVELSFFQSNIKLAEIPACLIIQMPRFGKDYKMYDRIQPSPYLDITDIMENGIRECNICGGLAVYECKECYEHFGTSLSKLAFCEDCKYVTHKHVKRSKHQPKEIKVSKDYLDYLEDLNRAGKPTDSEHLPIPRETMELFAILCIETSHYVAFVKAGCDPDAIWMFFDSMADRMGAESGYNIPEVRVVEELPLWLSPEMQDNINSIKQDKDLPGMMRRVLCDGYLCFYQSRDVMMYK
ncbi:ubiquitin carboxyl-terminal hydrolase CYLD isoform X1 [Lingula anatina]|uniref:ubiquitinyl hydrolase 1 n=1 Tax=Lingula anatina TaxID=7574 RepID=A0A2R2MSY0_LINAN|nr:ubiquitin carboxyl-terminal hydrolase CYLD isoform X1 [Lingula anatina]|eukprot:XP_023933361.1 ubiquitin carboxyl-terminal hydrolase CYLD isoform X1 [Lingula anatina]